MSIKASPTYCTDLFDTCVTLFHIFFILFFYDFSMNLTGKSGEEHATNYLVNTCKYTLIQRNFSTKYGEIDIITLDKEDFVCIEVKTSRSELYESPALRVSKQKLNRIYRTAEIFLQKKPQYRSFTMRIDVIAVVFCCSDSKNRIQHFKNVNLYDTI